MGGLDFFLENGFGIAARRAWRGDFLTAVVGADGCGVICFLEAQAPASARTKTAMRNRIFTRSRMRRERMKYEG